MSPKEKFSFKEALRTCSTLQVVFSIQMNTDFLVRNVELATCC